MTAPLEVQEFDRRSCFKGEPLDGLLRTPCYQGAAPRRPGWTLDQVAIRMESK